MLYWFLANLYKYKESYCSHPVVHACVHCIKIFMFFFFKLDISLQPLIRKHSYLDHRYPGGLALISWLLTAVSMPRGGARGQNLGTFKKCFSTFLLRKQLRQIDGRTSVSLLTMDNDHTYSDYFDVFINALPRQFIRVHIRTKNWCIPLYFNVYMVHIGLEITIRPSC